MEHDRNNLQDRKLHDTDRDLEARGDRDLNKDPITGAPGSHPVGTGLGAAGAGTVGAAIGAVAGPVGSLAGAAIGAVVGGLAGKGVAEAIDPTAEEAYWRDNYTSRPYVKEGETYEEYSPAYRFGWESRTRTQDRHFDEVEADLGRDWDRVRGDSSLNWDRAKHATRDAYDRVRSRGTTGAGDSQISMRGHTMGDAAAGTGVAVGDLGATRGTGMGDQFDDDYYRNEYTNRPYYEAGTPYDQYQPAYEYGHSLSGRHTGRSFDEIEHDISRDWDSHRGRSNLTWERAKHAVREAYERAKHSLSGHHDRH